MYTCNCTHRHQISKIEIQHAMLLCTNTRLDVYTSNYTRLNVYTSNYTRVHSMLIYCWSHVCYLTHCTRLDLLVHNAKFEDKNRYLGNARRKKNTKNLESIPNTCAGRQSQTTTFGEVLMKLKFKAVQFANAAASRKTAVTTPQIYCHLKRC